MNDFKDADNFITNVKHLESDDKISLRRAMGRKMEASGAKAIGAFYRAFNLNDTRTYIYFAMACVECYCENIDAKKRFKVEDVAKRLNDAERKHFIKLIMNCANMRMSENGNLLRMVYLVARYCGTERIALDTYSMLRDLLCWNSDKKISQKKWIRGCITFTEKSNEKGEEDGE